MRALLYVRLICQSAVAIFLCQERFNSYMPKILMTFIVPTYEVSSSESSPCLLFQVELWTQQHRPLLHSLEDNLDGHTLNHYVFEGP